MRRTTDMTTWRKARYLPALVAVAVAFASCSDDSPSGGGAAADAGSGDTGAGSDAASATDGGATTCTGACTKTTLTATFGSASGGFSRSQFGIDKKSGKLHIEAFEGGSAECPTDKSPDTDRTLVLEDVPVPSSSEALTDADGLRAALFDFKGDLLTANVLAKATSVKLTPVATQKSNDVVTAIAFDLELTFPQSGKLVGHLYAEHCASMDL